jgi:hypothetical protein
MFNELEGMMSKVITGEIDQQQVGQAAEEHLNATDPNELQQQVTTAANNASANGNSNLASQLFTLVQDCQQNPEGLKSDLVTLIQSNPQIVQHFAPEFAQGILSKI